MSDTEAVVANGISEHTEAVAAAIVAEATAPKRTRKPRETMRPAEAKPKYAALLDEAEEAERHADEARKAARGEALQHADSLEGQAKSMLDEAARIRKIVDVDVAPVKAKLAPKPIAKARAKRSVKPAAALGTSVIELAAKAGKTGIASGDVQSALRCDRERAGVLLRDAVARGALRRQGKARSTRYYAR